MNLFSAATLKTHRGRQVVICLLVVTVGVAIFKVLVSTQPGIEETATTTTLPSVEWVTAERQDLVHEVVAHGTVQPRTETTLVSEVAGRIVDVSEAFITGGFVDKNEVLLRVDPATYDAGVAAAKAARAQARAMLAREQAEAEVARREWKKYGKGQATDLVLRKPQVAQAEAAVASAEAMLRKAEIDLDRTVIRAPFAGRIRKRYVELGQFTAAGNPLTMIYSTDFAEVRLPLSPEETTFLNLPLGGMPDENETHATVTLEATRGTRRCQWQGSISHTEAEVDPRTRMIYAVVRVDDPYRRVAAAEGGDSEKDPLMVGMFVTARIQGRTVSDVTLVPRRALRADSTVLIIDSENRLQPRQVEVLRSGETEIVIGKGLATGEKVCLTQFEVFSAGMEITPAEEGP